MPGSRIIFMGIGLFGKKKKSAIFKCILTELLEKVASERVTCKTEVLKYICFLQKPCGFPWVKGHLRWTMEKCVAVSEIPHQ